MQAKTLLVMQELPIELTNGNTGRGGAFWSSAKARKRIEAILRGRGFSRDPFDCIVSMRLTRVLGKGQRLWDADSILRGNAKELIDALVAVGWFHDDGPKHISEVVGAQDATRRNDGPIVVVEVFRD